MNYEVLESEIVTRINSWLSDNPGAQVEVAPLADRQSDYKVAFQHARVFVCYQESDFDEPMATDIIVQEEKVHVKLMIEARQRTGVGGVFETFNRIKLAVTGYEPSHVEKLYVSKMKYEDFRDNVWYYSFNITGKTVSIQEFTEETGPPATSITATPPTGY
jgi:hypothetical protein